MARFAARRPAGQCGSHALPCIAAGQLAIDPGRLHRGQQFAAQRRQDLPAQPVDPFRDRSDRQREAGLRHAAVGQLDQQRPQALVRCRRGVSDSLTSRCPRSAASRSPISADPIFPAPKAARDCANLPPGICSLANSRSSSAARRLCRAASRSRSSSGRSTVSRRTLLLPTWLRGSRRPWPKA